MPSAKDSLKESDVYVYFLYSEQQFKERSEIEKKMSRVFTPGTVIVGGRKKLFTEISKTPKSRYPDFKVVAEGYQTKMVYTGVSSK